MRQAMSLSLDRQAFIDIISEGQGEIGAVMQPPPGGLWGMPSDLLKTLPGYDLNVEKSRAEARTGDVVTVTRIDRLARSTFDLFRIVNRIVDAKALFRSLAEPWADTGTSTGRLMLAALGGLADVETRPYPHPDGRGQKR
jgi:hypothetical protein